MHKNIKLSKDDVAKIIERRKAGEKVSDLAKEYKVHPITIYSRCKGKKKPGTIQDVMNKTGKSKKHVNGAYSNVVQKQINRWFINHLQETLDM